MILLLIDIFLNVSLCSFIVNVRVNEMWQIKILQTLLEITSTFAGKVTFVTHVAGTCILTWKMIHSENVWEVQIWIFVDVHSIWKWGHWYWVIWDFAPGWHANHNCEYIQTFTFNENVAKSDVLMKIALREIHSYTFRVGG